MFDVQSARRSQTLKLQRRRKQNQSEDGESKEDFYEDVSKGECPLVCNPVNFK